MLHWNLDVLRGVALSRLRQPVVFELWWANWNYNPGQKSLGQNCNIHIFLSFLGFLLKQCILFEIFLQSSLHPPYTKLKLGKNSGYTRPILFVGWGEVLNLCELENAPETQKCRKTFVHDCSSQSEFTRENRNKTSIVCWLVPVHWQE